MKKIFALLIAVTFVTVGFAQQRNDQRSFRNNDQYSRIQQRDQPGRSYQYEDNSYRGNDRGYNERDRREQMDRVNREYDMRINSYRNDRSINTYERNRRIGQAERERSAKIKSFGSGIAVGAIAGVLLGVLLSR